MMTIHYLGKLSQGDQKATYFWDKPNDVVVQAVACDDGRRVQALKRLILAEGRLKKGLPLEQLHAIIAAYNASIEIVTAAADEDWVKRLEPLKDRKRNLLESALRKLEKDLAERENEFTAWKGVRDLTEAHENFQNRSYEIRDLNQKLYHVDREAQFIYHPGHPLRTTPSLHQSVLRFHLRELKDQAKERSSALRLRIDFTKRQAIKDLKDKRKQVLAELEDESKREKDYAKTIAELVDQSSAAALALTVRSPAILVQGRMEAVVRACAEEVAESAKRLARSLKEKLGLDFVAGPSSWIASFTAACQQAALVGRDGLVDEVSKVASATMGRIPAPAGVPEINFPRFDGSRRQAYLGVALSEGQSPTSIPVLYDLDALSRHVLIVGGTGSGKTQLARVIVESLLLQDSPVPVLIIDPTGSWTGLAEACGSNSMFEKYEAFGMKKEWARLFPFQLLNATEPATELAGKAVNYDGASVLATHTMSPGEETAAVRSLLQALQAEIQTWPEGATRFALVMDEAHKFLADKDLNEVAQFLARTARLRGAGLIFISQNWTDVGDIRSNCQTKAQMASGYGPDLVRASQVFGSDYRNLVPKLKQGHALVNYPEWGTALVQVRPSLSQPGTISRELLEVREAASKLSDIAATLTRHAATGDTTTAAIAVTSGNAVEPARDGETTRSDKDVSTRDATDWRDVAARFKGSGLSASTISEEITKAGLSAPSVRTIQRFSRCAARSE